MKANFKNKVPITMTKEDFEKIVKAEKEKLYDDVENLVASQLIAVVLVTLEINYGWKKDRLNKFISALNATAELACKTNIFGNEVDTDDLIQHLIDKYGIDCRAQVKGM